LEVIRGGNVVRFRLSSTGHILASTSYYERGSRHARTYTHGVGVFAYIDERKLPVCPSLSKAVDSDLEGGLVILRWVIGGAQ
jgi:hypothetical protein